MYRDLSGQESGLNENDYVFENLNVSEINNIIIANHSTEELDPDRKGYSGIYPERIELNRGSFTDRTSIIKFPTVEVEQQEDKLILSCKCDTFKKKLCLHQSQVLYSIVNRQDLRIFFDKKLRHEKLVKIATDFGLEDEPNLDQYFQIEYFNSKLGIKPKYPEILAVTRESLSSIEEQLIKKSIPDLQKPNDFATINCVVIKHHKFYKHLFIELYDAQTSKDGNIKNPLNLLNPLDFVWKTNNSEEIRFYTALGKFQNNFATEKSISDLEALNVILKNPANVNFYYHNKDYSENVTTASITPVRLKKLSGNIELTVTEKGLFYEVSGNIKIGDKGYDLKDLKLKFTYFIHIDGLFYLVDNLNMLLVIEFFKKQKNNIRIYKSKFPEFRNTILQKLENHFSVSYSHIKKGTTHQIKKNGFNEKVEKIIYLSESGNYVIIDPLLKYGDVEIPVLTKRQIYSVDDKGAEFLVRRDKEAEINFTSLLVKQHDHFMEQLEEGQLHFYLHKDRFLDEEWFLNAFDEWKNHGIRVLGFNEIKENKFNPNKAKVSILVTSGVNWFNTDINVRFGKKRASLKQIQRSVKNKSKYVQLDDGTVGILPNDWLEKFSTYFLSGEVKDDILRIPKINYSTLNSLYDEEMLAQEVKDEIASFQSKLSDFESIKEVEVPKSLNGELRIYQKQGLNWLSFLDEFNFGGCLADDMGLGKSVQVLSFILSQRAKVARNTNLIVVPTSLIFNWQEEIQKFAPSLKTYANYGTNRVKDIAYFDQYEVILISYNTLLSDILFLKDYKFNYIFLDESQNIKNPESQRYKAVCLLKSRNRIAISGTPIENNTFDLYGQLSFACPGLLGNKRHFRDIYSIPIDKFKDNKRAGELQKKIDPFILRRTKTQVATELPNKTEMVIYCELNEEQRKVYDSYEKGLREFISSTSNEDLPKRSMHVLKGLTRLRQICNSPLLLKEERPKVSSSSKIDTLIEQIEAKSSQHKILIFSQFVSMLDLIRKELDNKQIGYEYLTGSTTNRNEVVNSFREEASVRVFLISLKAGGTGLNLTEADYVYIVDPWWNPAVENQAIDRCYRIGQKKNVVAVRLICPQTIEEKILKLQESKKDLFNGLINTDNSVLKSLSKKELIGLFNS